jgi:high-affinity nickel-transport protein
MYPVGLLMGLGFDTATQVALLVLAGGTAALSLPWYAILYNLTVTTISVVAALGIGSVVLLQLLADRTDLPGRALAAVAAVDLGHVGPSLVALLLVAWSVGAVLAHRRVPGASAATSSGTPEHVSH